MSLSSLRARIEEARSDHAHAEGQRTAQEAEITKVLVELRKTLKCKTGGEKAALEKLRTKLAEDEAELERLLDEAEEAQQEARDQA